MYERILVPTDGCDVSAIAEQAAIVFARAHGSEIAALAVEQPQAAGVRCTPLAVIDYQPSHAIVDAAGRHGCDLIFMGPHGRRGLSRLFACSVTQQVLADTPVPVMVFRPQVCPREAA